MFGINLKGRLNLAWHGFDRPALDQRTSRAGLDGRLDLLVERAMPAALGEALKPLGSAAAIAEDRVVGVMRGTDQAGEMRA